MRKSIFLKDGVCQIFVVSIWNIEYAHGILTSCSFTDLLVPSPQKKTNIAEILPQEPEYAGAFREALTDRYLIFVNSSSASVFWAQVGWKVNNLSVIMWGILGLRNILMIDDVFILQTSKEMIPLGLDFPASLGGEVVFF